MSRAYSSARAWLQAPRFNGGFMTLLFLAHPQNYSFFI
jgi:hypothetical protein